MEMNGFFSTGLGAVVLIFLLVLAVIWVLLPFAIIAIQKRVTEQRDISSQLLQELKKLNRGVSMLVEQGESGGADEVKPGKAASLTRPATSKTCPHCMQENAIDRETCSRCKKQFE